MVWLWTRPVFAVDGPDEFSSRSARSSHMVGQARAAAAARGYQPGDQYRLLCAVSRPRIHIGEYADRREAQARAVLGTRLSVARSRESASGVQTARPRTGTSQESGGLVRRITGTEARADYAPGPSPLTRADVLQYAARVKTIVDGFSDIDPEAWRDLASILLLKDRR